MTLRFGICVANVGPFGDPAGLVELGVAAEEAGWDGFFVNDHVLYHRPDWPVANPTVVLGALAARTTRIRLGTLMTALPRRRPQVVAREVETLAALAGPGRVAFGAGLGSMDAEYSTFGEDPSLRARAALLDSGLLYVSRAWSGAVPIWCAGRWPRKAGFRRAARWDGAVATFEGHDRTAPPPSQVQAVAEFLGPGKDLLVEGASEPDTSLALYAGAGLTWWLEAFFYGRGTPAAALVRVASGPPAG